MKKEFDFNKTGKRMPYKVPEGFFDEWEANVLKAVDAVPPAPAKPRRMPMRWVVRVVSVAAAVALLWVFHIAFVRQAEHSFADVEMAFSSLNAEDQAYLLEVYQEDIFMIE